MIVGTASSDGKAMTVRGEVVMTIVSESVAHRLSVGKDSFRCAHCDEDHAIGFVQEDDAGSESTGIVAIRYAEEAWELARFLLVDVFRELTPGGWAAIEVMARMDDGTGAHA